MPTSRPAPGLRRVILDLPAELHEWLLEAAEISHRTPEAMLTDLLRHERTRWDENWDPPAPS